MTSPVHSPNIPQITAGELVPGLIVSRVFLDVDRETQRLEIASFPRFWNENEMLVLATDLDTGAKGFVREWEFETHLHAENRDANSQLFPETDSIGQRLLNVSVNVANVALYAAHPDVAATEASAQDQGHGRYRTQNYFAFADWQLRDRLKRCDLAAKNLSVFSGPEQDAVADIASKLEALWRSDETWQAAEPSQLWKARVAEKCLEVASDLCLIVARLPVQEQQAPMGI